MDFAQVETKFKELKGQFEAGALTEAEFKAQLEDLMLQDEEGKWWMIGYETGQWYYHDGEQWVQGEPPPVVERRREQVEALCQEGTTALAAEDWGTAIEKFEAALALEPDHPEATRGLAEAKVRVAEAPKPEVPKEPVAPPAAPTKMRWGWVVAVVVVVILVGIVLQSGITPSPGPGPEVGFWAEPEVIPPGGCTDLHWDALNLGLEWVRLWGPGLDPEFRRPPEGVEVVCLEESATVELKSPDWEVIATTTVYVER